LGFLEISPFCCEKPRFCGFEKLGFPWILSSESRLINGLQEKIEESFFYSPFSPENGHRGSLALDSVRGGTNCSWDKLNLISDFLQEIAVRGRSFLADSIQRRLALLCAKVPTYRKCKRWSSTEITPTTECGPSTHGATACESRRCNEIRKTLSGCSPETGGAYVAPSR
jgi:hypothetical protein